MKKSTFSRTGLIAVLLLVAGSSLSINAAAQKLSAIVGMSVQTETGEKVGMVEDFAINAETGSIDFVVISIGSFLIEDGLIAIPPGALQSTARGEPVVVRKQDLTHARRFGADSWPNRTEVRSAVATNRLAGTLSQANDGSTGNDSGSSSGANGKLSNSGTATITAGSRKATYTDGKRELINGPIRRAAAPTPAKNNTPQMLSIVPNFKNLDSNRDGRLSKDEIAAQLGKHSAFRKLDRNFNGTIDDDEYAEYAELESLKFERRWVGNRSKSPVPSGR